MPIGKEVGSFTAKATSIEKDVDAAGNNVFTLNFEGSVSGGWNGSVVSTMTSTTSDYQTGTYTSTVSVYLEDGSVVEGAGSGVFRSVSGHKWQLNGTDLVSDGSCIASESLLTLADKSLNGKIFEIT